MGLPYVGGVYFMISKNGGTINEFDCKSIILIIF